MAIPTYTVINDSEIDPESPLTSSLMFRLRDNILALLGIDPATPSPTMNIGESVDSRRTLTTVWDGLAANITSNEVVVSTISGLSLESVEVLRPYRVLMWNGGNPYAFPLSYHCMFFDAYYVTSCLTFDSVQVPYVAGVPQSTEVTYSIYAFNASNTETQLVFTSPNDNTWRTIISYGGFSVSVKTRSDATSVYAQFAMNRGGNSNYISYFHMKLRKTQYRSKNAASA